jgi:hypothetical protein
VGRLAFEKTALIDPRFYNQTLTDEEADELAEKDPGLVQKEGNVCWYELEVSDYLLDPKAYKQKDVYLRIRIKKLQAIDLYISYGLNKKN